MTDGNDGVRNVHRRSERVPTGCKVLRSDPFYATPELPANVNRTLRSVSAPKAAGDIIRAHNEETGELEDVTIDSIEQDEYGDYTINGGLENGGIDLLKDRGVFRTRSEDDYPVYYEIGEVTLPFAEDVTLEDSSASPTASEQQSAGMADVARDIADSDNWAVNNTTVFVQDGHVFDIQRVWVP